MKSRQSTDLELSGEGKKIPIMPSETEKTLKSAARLKTMIKKLFWLKQVIVHLRFRLHQEEGSRVVFRHRRLEVDRVSLYMYQNIVQHRK